MAALRVRLIAPALAAALAVAPAPAWAGALQAQVDRWSAHIAEASARFSIPEEWIRRVMRAESGGRTELRGRPIVSRAGAMGLMQLMPGTWAQMRYALGLGADPHAPRDNILAGTAYLRAMYDRFGYPGLFGAYNAGPGRYAEHLARGRRLPGETVAYMAAITGRRPAASAAYRPPVGVAPMPMFPVSGQSGQPAPQRPARVPPSAEGLLFVPLRTVPAPPGVKPPDS